MKNRKKELSDGEVEEAFFRGFFYTKCKCGHHAIDHVDGRGRCKKVKYYGQCNCVKFKKDEKNDI